MKRLKFCRVKKTFKLYLISGGIVPLGSISFISPVTFTCPFRLSSAHTLRSMSSKLKKMCQICEITETVSNIVLNVVPELSN